MIDSVYFERIYKQWSGKVYNFIIGLSNGDRYLAEEIVQATFLKVWENRSSVDQDKNVSAYLFTIAKNQLYNYFSRQELMDIYKKSQDSVPCETDSISELNLDYQSLMEAVQSIVEQMPPSRKKIFLLSRRQHLSNKEIANTLAISENTVESQMTKALNFLRKGLQEQGYTEAKSTHEN